MSFSAYQEINVMFASPPRHWLLAHQVLVVEKGQHVLPLVVLLLQDWIDANRTREVLLSFNFEALDQFVADHNDLDSFAPGIAATVDVAPVLGLRVYNRVFRLLFQHADDVVAVFGVLGAHVLHGFVDVPDEVIGEGLHLSVRLALQELALRLGELSDLAPPTVAEHYQVLFELLFLQLGPGLGQLTVHSPLGV